jgi:hypothetical protein
MSDQAPAPGPELGRPNTISQERIDEAIRRLGVVPPAVRLEDRILDRAAMPSLVDRQEAMLAAAALRFEAVRDRRLQEAAARVVDPLAAIQARHPERRAAPAQRPDSPAKALAERMARAHAADVARFREEYGINEVIRLLTSIDARLAAMQATAAGEPAREEPSDG